MGVTVVCFYKLAKKALTRWPGGRLHRQDYFLSRTMFPSGTAQIYTCLAFSRGAKRSPSRVVAGKLCWAGKRGRMGEHLRGDRHLVQYMVWIAARIGWWPRGQIRTPPCREFVKVCHAYRHTAQDQGQLSDLRSGVELPHDVMPVRNIASMPSV